jgi:hypothetical protein
MDTETTDTAEHQEDERLRPADVGSRVSAILAAAERAAEELRVEAKREVSELLGRAESDAAARISELTAEAKSTRGDADDYASDVRLAVDTYASQRRREAEEEGRRAVAEAEEQARAMRETAEDMARQIDGDAHRRVDELRQEIKLLEDRRERAFQSLRDVAAQLEDVLLRPRVGERAEQVESRELRSALDERA